MGATLEIAAGHGLPLWRELFTAYDWWLLHTSAVWFGAGVPAGDGSPVITIPGLPRHRHATWSTCTAWLERVGLPVVCLGHRVQCRLPEPAADEADSDAGARAHRDRAPRAPDRPQPRRRPRAVDRRARRPDLVASVITLGAPFRGIRSHPVVLRTRDIVRTIMFGRPAGPVPAVRLLHGAAATASSSTALDRFPTKVRELAIYTKADGVVDWRMCVTGNADEGPRGARHAHRPRRSIRSCTR